MWSVVLEYLPLKLVLAQRELLCEEVVLLDQLISLLLSLGENIVQLGLQLLDVGRETAQLLSETLLLAG